MTLGHCHVGPPGHFQSPWAGLGPEDGTLEHLARYLGELGFARAVAFAPFARWFDGDPNAWLLDAVRGDTRFLPWATLNEGGDAAAKALDRAADAGIRGVKFHPPVVRLAIDDPAVAPVFAVAEARRLPVLIHAGPHGWRLDAYRPLLVDRIAQEFPKLPLVVEHLGGRAFAHETYAVLQNNRNVYGGLATCLPADSGWHVPTDVVRDMIGAFGAERFVFGADFPYNGVAANRLALETLRGIGLPEPEVRLILSGNLERLNEQANPGAPA